jgi:ABC-type branched-subunit amino acid transport system substrate-binding protein
MEGKRSRRRAVVLAVTLCLVTAGVLLPTTSATGASGVKGSAYKLYYTNPGATSASDYLPAIAKAINATGGIGGHPLEFVDCVDKTDPNQATQCAQKATSDPSVLGIVSNTATCGSQLQQTLQDAKMASIGDQFFCTEAFNAPNAFPFAAGSLDPAAGAAIAVEQLKKKDLVIATIDVPAGRQYPPFVQTLVKPVDGNVTGAVYIPFSAADMAPYASQVVSKGGFLLDGLTTEVGIRLGKALQQQGFTEPTIYNGTTWDPRTIKSNFGNPKNAYVETPFPPNSAGSKMFAADMKKYSKTQYLSTDLSTSWLAAKIIQRWAKDAPDITAAALLDYLSTTPNIDTYGMTIPLDFTKPGTVLGGAAPRIVNPCTALYHYVNGRLVPVGKSVDVLSTTPVDCAA